MLGVLILEPVYLAAALQWSRAKLDLILLLAGTTREHLGLALALKVPIFLVLSKVDLVSGPAVQRTLRQLQRVLKQPGCNKVPFLVSGPDDAVTAAQQFTQSTSITPILLVSSVGGEGLQLLQVFLNLLPPLSSSQEQEELMEQPTEFQVDEIFSVPEVGTVAATLALGNFDRSLLRKLPTWTVTCDPWRKVLAWKRRTMDASN
ncbi:hypothetical protein CRUP_007826 [Coryphaenoides rupestris]|nr:hypothetical protein CRUP_007826 [Coryphaenoides rupestris]